MKYEYNEKRELDVKQYSIASIQMCDVIELLAHNRNNEVKFHELIHFAKDLQAGLVKIEEELKKQLRNQ